ncbi:MAG: hypothetical protein A3B86_03085 [Candidatus Yanofskybacteria bacterium RIFCSPHIGHO2_02_FULL_38_22b]|uniref:ASCH domain-containing protein n=1 Tax=Candidatus Yanofskybacteria bacterium RIFCSPHIGHO2_02_FULL_38_22b TaxID=1802673 RepID=A0A1F8F159_9BACT|nr:MAG: hypothetical protein A2816_02680 [Candidatus Yanofskybacteria bacterium RIFCSPHIGHO2_01_FULL_39_44]OGN06855.1 MAG: hypothetical protein A3B86_03085 [Candidatus Yanofskybacteria bacterium RIFCSPHIGHO2_02_FULL_38_22b]OGN20750.1 MAG: hypothetical protein A2910_01045 [Candidatus Yanofskybacteria bacterium RIFCSPLOWO2_01_FULL_39_28]
MKRVFVFIDGNNLYYRVKSVADHYTRENGKRYSTINFRFRYFCNSFKAEEAEIVEIHYYVGQVKRFRNQNHKDSAKSEKMYADQQRLVGYLQKENISVKFGKLLKDPDSKGAYHEKGVDVQIAVEMIRFARENKYDIAYLISSDSDLLSAVQEVKSFKKEISYIGVKLIPSPEQLEELRRQNKDLYAISYALTKNASDYKLIEKEQVIPFLPIIKSLKFKNDLVGKILGGSKTSTWRLFDDKDLTVGDRLVFINSDNNKIFANTEITSINIKKLGELKDADSEGHEKYKDQDDMLKHYRGCYGDKVTLDTEVKMIKFKLIR